eukprot:Nitzschia sp. Nitz4//scaffold9_size221794//76701//80874//NITZ4_001339-RA/size221794-snap-gene-0.181-mRNA-1//-1//CDS//3329560980//2908//frame0
MVGFGSSLRMGRRSGWEAAYMDYETLKLLLSQIESVYEEEKHRSSTSREVFVGEESEDQNARNSRNRWDYRDELFLESNSDVAYASSADSDLESSEDSQQQQRQQPNQNRMDLKPQGNIQRFTMMGSSSSEDSASMDDTDGRCGGVPWSTSRKAHRSKKRRGKPKVRYPQEDGYYVPRDSNGPKGFLVDEESDSFDPNSSTLKTSSLFNAPFQYNTKRTLDTPDENSSLLVYQGFASSSTENFGDITPPIQHFGTDPYQNTVRTGTKSKQHSSNDNAVAVTQQQSPVFPNSLLSKWQQEHRRARRQRRRRQRAKRKKARDKKVPPYIRAAHSKSRAITERFLGLLRAEVEKVTLFAQARLGELADTAGSLRFLSSEELTEMSGALLARASSAVYDYPLSDGGIHPSASSSSDDGGGGPGAFSWSDSSSSDEGSRDSALFPAQPSGGLPPAKKTSLTPQIKRSKREAVQYDAAKRKIDHFQDLRRERPIFQRNDHIVGEDLLLVSAVDEADAYSAVGVELLHILKYICVNVIAVRKICRKHDRLLQNRMLGGYYHRLRTTQAQEERTLGGLVGQIAGDIYEGQPVRASHGKLLGIYDLTIQQLANSRTVKVISSSLALALSEYEVSRTRADALAALNSTTKVPQNRGQTQKAEPPSSFVSFDFGATSWVTGTKDKLASPCIDGEVDSLASDVEGSGPPSTSSSMSLARLRFTVLSIAALREASRSKIDMFATFLSRSSLVFSGNAIVGEGLDGCSRETLDFLVAYAPDAALLLDSGTLHEGLLRGHWRNISIASVMKSSLAVTLAEGKSTVKEEKVITNALSIIPISEQSRFWPSFLSFDPDSCSDVSLAFLQLNRNSCFLYSANYYIIYPTTTVFTVATGANVAYAAAIIGATSFAALFSAALQSHILSRQSSARPDETAIDTYRWLLMGASVAAIFGNLIHIHAINEMSISWAVLGRLFIGLAHSDIIHRQFIMDLPDPNLIVPQSAQLILFQTLGMVAGLFAGSLVELAPFRSGTAGVQSLQISDWMMTLVWVLHLGRLVFARVAAKSSRNLAIEDPDATQWMEGGEPDNHSSDSSTSEPNEGVAVRLFHQPPERRALDGSMSSGLLAKPVTSFGSVSRASVPSRVPKSHKRKVVSFAKRLRKVLLCNVSVPLTLALVMYSVYAEEALFSSCALISHRYFGWRGGVAGLLLCGLGLTILPILFFGEQIARRYEERTTMRKSVMLLILGLLIMVNWGSVFAMVANLKLLFTETLQNREHVYDWLLGIPQYVIGFFVSFTSLKALEGSSRSLLSKVSPPYSKHILTNLGTMATFGGLLAQFLANIQILGVGVSHRVINADIVNSIVVALLMGCLVSHFFIRKHFFFLM